MLVVAEITESVNIQYCILMKPTLHVRSTNFLYFVFPKPSITFMADHCIIKSSLLSGVIYKGVV